VPAAFVTSTGTEIGKTFVTAGLVRHLRRAGRRVAALKPVVSGFDPGLAEASDPGVLLAALGRPVMPEEIAAIAPWRFEAPLAPDLAARREGRRIQFPELINFCRGAIDPGTTLLIEGVGGVMVPLDERHTVIDWIAVLQLPVILVAGSYLGTISHTLTALHALAQRDLSTYAVVVSETPGSTVTLEDTVASISQFAGPTRVIALPRLEAAAAETHPSFAAIAALFA
jgi:dethiobiotin synthetase